MKLIDKDTLVAEIEKKIKQYEMAFDNPSFASYEASLIAKGKYRKLLDVLQFLDTIEVKEVDIDKLCEFRKNIGFAYPEGASEYQKQLACYRQGIKDAIEAQKGEEV